jgi:hypothetical protein
MTAQEYLAKVEEIRQEVELLIISHPNLHEFSKDYQRGYKDCMTEMLALDRLGAPMDVIR